MHGRSIAKNQTLINTIETRTYAIGVSRGNINVNGGNIFQTLVTENSRITITSGTVQQGDAYSGNLYISGGDIAMSTVLRPAVSWISGGNVGNIFVNGTLNINGGNVTSIQGFDTGKINISGGGISDLIGLNQCIINLSGGLIASNTIRLSDQSVLNVFGSGLGVTLLGTDTDSQGAYTDYLLSGILQNGDSLDGVHLHDYDGGYQITNPSDPNSPISPLNFNPFVIAAPEPTSLALLVIVGCVGLMIGERRFLCSPSK